MGPVVIVQNNEALTQQHRHFADERPFVTSQVYNNNAQQLVSLRSRKSLQTFSKNGTQINTKETVYLHIDVYINHYILPRIWDVPGLAFESGYPDRNFMVLLSRYRLKTRHEHNNGL